MSESLLATRLSHGVERPDRARRMTPDDRRAIVRSLGEMIAGSTPTCRRSGPATDSIPSSTVGLLGERAADQELSDAEFHAAITRIFTELRDAHTRYVPPGPRERLAAVLPILVERYVEDGTTVFTASKVTPASDEEARRFRRLRFEAGVTITHWNAVPIDRAVSNYADFETAGRPDARTARALESLTIRPLRYLPPPDEDWVTISFTTRRGARRQVRLEWRTATGRRQGAAGTDRGGVARLQPHRHRCAAGQEDAARHRCVGVGAGPDRSDADAFAGTVRRREVRLRGRTYGHLRIYSFGVQDDQAFIDHVESLVAGMPDTGLIIDLRANPGATCGPPRACCSSSRRIRSNRRCSPWSHPT